MRILAHTILLLAAAAPYSQAKPSESPPEHDKARSATVPPDRPSAAQDADGVDLYIKTSMSRQHIPGLTLVVIRDGKIKKVKAYGLASVELNVAARPETVYELASATKPFVATAVMLLVQDEKIGLEDPVSKFVENTPHSWKGITVRHLLTHTSGIKDYLSDLRRDFPHDTPPEAIVRAAIDAPLNFTPGEKWSSGLVSRVVVKLEPILLDSYTGYYNVFGSQVLKVTRNGDDLLLDDGGRLVNSFLSLSETKFVAEDADRGFKLTKTKNGEVSGMTLRLVADEMPVQRIGPLFGSLKPRPDPDRVLTRKVEAILRAFAVGGTAVEEVSNVAPQARKDYSRGPSPELDGIRAISFITAQDVSDRGIERHRGKVARILYFGLLTDRAPRHVLVYLTADGLVTDQNTVNE